MFVPEQSMIMAGLLTFSIFRRPSRSVLEQWQEVPSNLQRLQQRELSRIYTWFPIIPFPATGTGTIISTNIDKIHGTVTEYLLTAHQAVQIPNLIQFMNIHMAILLV